VDKEQYRLKNQSIKMQTIISDNKIMWCPRVVHKTVVDLGWNFRGEIQLHTGSGGLNLIF